ncbi:hypothetical protein [Marinomonas sp.]
MYDELEILPRGSREIIKQPKTELINGDQNENSLKNLRYLQKVFRVSLKADLRFVISISQAGFVGSALAEGGIDDNQAQSCNSKINPNIIGKRG